MTAVERGTGIAGGLSAAILRMPFDGEPVKLTSGRSAPREKVKAKMFSARAKGAEAALTGVSSELLEEGAGEAVYRTVIGLMFSAPVVGTGLDAAMRARDWIDGILAADPTLGGTCIHASMSEAEFTLGAESNRIVVDASVAVVHARSGR